MRMRALSMNKITQKVYTWESVTRMLLINQWRIQGAMVRCPPPLFGLTVNFG